MISSNKAPRVLHTKVNIDPIIVSQVLYKNKNTFQTQQKKKRSLTCVHFRAAFGAKIGHGVLAQIFAAGAAKIRHGLLQE